MMKFNQINWIKRTDPSNNSIMCSSFRPPRTLNFFRLHTWAFSYFPNVMFSTMAGRSSFRIKNYTETRSRMFNKTRVTGAMHTIYIYNCSLVTTLHCFIIYSKFPILHKYLIPRFYCFVSNRRNVKLQALNLTFVFRIWVDFLCTR